jgi:hypothetical protein
MDATYRLLMFKAKAKELESLFTENSAFGRMITKGGSENKDH